MHKSMKLEFFFLVKPNSANTLYKSSSISYNLVHEQIKLVCKKFTLYYKKLFVMLENTYNTFDYKILEVNIFLFENENTMNVVFLYYLKCRRINESTTRNE